LKLNIKVKPNSRQNIVTKIDDFHFEVRLTSSPDKGKANKHLIDFLSDYFKIPKSKIEITSGFSSRNKIVEIS
jgi:uncharacterized protein